MSLKNAIENRLSIRARLTLFYSLAAFILLSIITLGLYWETINILYKADYKFLADYVETTQYILSNNHANLSALRQEVLDASLQNEESIYRYYVRVYDSAQRMAIETPGMQTILPVGNKIALAKINSKNYFWFQRDNQTYLTIQAPIRLAHHRFGVVEIALDITHQHAVISDRKQLLAILLGSAICSLLLGYLIARRGMRSLYDLTETVKNITAKSLDKRIDPKHWPKELQQLGNAFNQMLDRIESSFMRLKQFSSDLAHELRTPINNLRGQTEIALNNKQSVLYYQSILASNLEEIQRISQLMENILFLARAENPKIEIEKEELDLRKEMQSVCEFYQPVAEEKNITLLYQGQASMQANPILFKRMINNILSNALNYTPANGEVKLEIRDEAENVAITLSDTGIGIAEDQLSKIFDRFYRVDAARSQHSGGTGLGLAIVKSIVDLHHGKISIKSIVNIGTTIDILLPK